MEILGLIDTLESVVCDSIKIPFTGKTLINEADVLSIIDKMRLVLQSGEGFIKTKIASKTGEILQHAKTQEIAEARTSQPDNPEGKAAEIIQQAYQVSKEIRSGADRYADDVLSKLEATTSRIIRTIKNGRLRLSKADISDAEAQRAIPEMPFDGGSVN
jgi:hypothetical protein